jgi:hypothetical protein
MLRDGTSPCTPPRSEAAPRVELPLDHPAERAQRRTDIERDLRSALDNDELAVQ